MPGAALVTLQVALAVMLLTGGTLLVRSLATLLQRDLGYERAGLVTAEASLLGTYPVESFVTEWQPLEQRLTRVPGVANAGLANWIPTGSGGSGFIDVEGVEHGAGGSPAAGFRVVSDGYLDAIGVGLLFGRKLDSRDNADSEPVTVINRRMAELLWSGEDPIGRRIQAFSMEGSTVPGLEAPWRRVVGVVENVRHGGYESDPEPEMYVSLRQVSPFRVGSMAAVIQALPGWRQRG
jgi:putative ABC transport system permease protein